MFKAERVIHGSEFMMVEPPYKEKTVVARVDPNLHTEARLKSVREGVALSEVIRAFLTRWVAGEVETPKEKQPEQK